MATINRITLTSAEVSQDDTGIFDIDANWDVAKSGGSYTNSYFMQIVANGSVVKEQEITNSGGDTYQDGTISISGINPNDLYYLQITDDTKNIKSPQALLLFTTYEGVTATYDGKLVSVKWDKPSRMVKDGRCTMNSIDGNSVSYTIAPNLRHLDFEALIEDYDPNNIWSLSLVPMISQIVDGPSSNLLKLYTQPSTILSITSTQNEQQENLIDLMITFTQPYGNTQALMVKTILWKNGSEVLSNSPVIMPQPLNNSYTLTLSVSKVVVDPNRMSQYAVGVYLCTENTTTIMNTDSNFCQLTNAKIFKRAYYPVYTNDVVTGIVYRETSDTETVTQVIFYEELFQSPIVQPIMSATLSLAREADGYYLLTVNTQSPLSQTDYTAFLTNLSQNGLLISALYKIQDTIMRAGNLNLTDVLYYHCGLDKNTRCADLRPGFTLEVETAIYMPTYQIQNEDAAPGFVSAHTAQYNISTRPEGADIRLEFNSFIDQFAENIIVASDTDEVQAGGILDLFVNGYRQPFYKIVYPSSFISSNNEQTHYQSDNVLLIGAGTYIQMQDVQKNISRMASYGDNDNASVLLFRGRSAVTLKIAVWVNGVQLLVPVGTTLGKLLETQAVYSSGTANVTMERMSAMGYTSVQLETHGNNSQTDSFWRILPLVHGDKIEVN